MKKRPVYDPAKIEKKWQKKWTSSKLYRASEKTGQGKYYVLDMFPYPSGDGLHVGHPKGYIATDIVSRMKRMQGLDILHPMGFDAFGLPAENYAIKMKTNPMVSVAKNVKRFKQQLELIGLDYDWSREVNTTDPKFYKWTQWIFLQLFKKGLAYESYEPINWCPSCKTGLANEDVEDGRCERCGTPVEKKPMRQWVLKITDYADRLLTDLDASGGIPLVTRAIGEDAFRPDDPISERDAAVVIIKHWHEDKYLCARWKATHWQGFVIGGREEGESLADTAAREIREETGYKNVRFIREFGRVDSKFFQKVKKHNRFAHFTGVYVELLNDEREETNEEEKSLHEHVWLSRDEVRDFTNYEDMTYLWDLFTGAKKQEIKPLLNWPESIKEAQRNWIGRSEGAEIDFRLVLKNHKSRFVILHGYTGSAKNNFIPWLKAELQQRGHEVETPELPNSTDPKESEQVEYVLKNCKLDEYTVVIGHSLGAIVAMKALMKLNRPISGLVLVAAAMPPGFNKNSKPRVYHKNFDWDFDYKLINKLAQGRVAVLSDIKEEKRIPWLKQLTKELSGALTETSAAKEHFCALQEPAVLESVTPNVKVFTTRPDTLFGVTYMVLAPEHPWVKELLPRLENKQEVEQYMAQALIATQIERTDLSKEKTGVELKGVWAVNPANKEEVPVWIADYVLADYGTGAVMAVPAHDERDLAFAKKYGLQIRQVIVPEFGTKRENEEERGGGCGVVFDPVKQKYAAYKREDGKVGLFAGGLNKGEDLQEGILREITEESGLYDFEKVEVVEKARAHYYHSLKHLNRVADATCLLVILKKSDSKDVKHEAHEKFDLVWLSADELDDGIRSWNGDGNHHWLRFIQQAIGLAIELGYDKTSDKIRFKASAYVGDGRLMNSDMFDNKESSSVMRDITTFVSGRWVTRYKLRDWVFSRQRYWGEPIPVIHCDKCGVVAVPEKDLPVKLPKVKSYEPTGTGESPLAAIDKWVNVKCPQCGGKGKRETNTMPQWAGSSWYYLRYEDPNNKKQLVDPAKEKHWSPVDLYVGGAEHATRHLIYARFWHKFLYDIGAVSYIEPFTKLQSVGLIMGEDGRKMSKRFGNVINPDDIIATYGADTLRLYEMFMGPFDQQIAWSTASMVGSRRFIERVWKFADRTTGDTAVPTIIHRTIKKVTDDIQGLKFNTAISTLMICLNELEKSESVSRTALESYLKLLAPFAPHVAEELWSSMGNKKSIHTSEWPKCDPDMLIESEVKIMLQVNGKVRGSFMAPTGTGKEDLEKMARDLPEAKKWLEAKEIRRTIVVPDKLVNIVAT